MLVHLQVVPDIIKVRCRKCALPQGGLDPHIIQYIDAAGLTGLFKVPNMEVDHALITTLVERWCPETHTFHLPHGEMGITLQDIEVMLRILVDGLLVTGRINQARIKYKWLDAQFAAPPAADAGDEVVQQHAHYHLLVWMGALLFMDKSTDWVSLLPLQFFNPISGARQYSWGSAALAWLYRHLCRASKKDAMQIRGALLLMLLWAYSRWSGPKSTAEHATHVLAVYWTSLATLRAKQE
ncbi:serine/threonine-protein phosphatase 7 long form homolog [Quercus suber]|uniref:serine/threonine-protein phosphatase 7 long form homolog n=1 Tax=Quercus suber TaxID=58331 RepID=UPI0032DFAFDF